MLQNLRSTLTTCLPGFQYMTETVIAVQRIDKFLSMPEPPPPVHMRHRSACGSGKAGGPGAVDVPADGSGKGGAGGRAGVVMSDLPDGYVELGGADYDWATNVEEMAAQVCVHVAVLLALFRKHWAAPARCCAVHRV